MRFGELGVVYAFAHGSHAEAADRRATAVEGYLVIELCPRELAYLQDVVQEFDEVVHVASAIRRIGRGGEFVPYMVRVAAGWSDDMIKSGEISGEEFFRCLRFLITPAIRGDHPGNSHDSSLSQERI